MDTHETLRSSTFDVTEVPIVVEGIVNSNDYKFIVRNDTSEVVSCMTKDYKLVTNQEVVDKALPRIEEKGGELTEMRTFGNGARTHWTFQFKDNPVTIHNDVLFPQICIKNSYDGTSQVAVLGGVWREVCANGAIIGKIFEKHSEKHSVWNTNLNNGHITSLVDSTINNMDKVFNKEFPILFNTNASQKDIVRVIEKLPQQYNEDVINYLLAHKPKTYWDLFNLCTWLLTHRANRDHETTHKLETEVYHTVRRMANVARA